MSVASSISKAYCAFNELMEKLTPVALLAGRLYIARIFLKSGIKKAKDMNGAEMLFKYEYELPLIPADIAAYLATAAEIIFPIMLILGMAARFGAIGIFIMVLVIELLVFPGTTEHYYQMIILGIIMTHGAGKLSVDHLLLKRK